MPALDFSKWSPGGNTTLFFPAAGLDAARQAELARQAIARTVDYFRSLGMPTCLTELGCGLQSEEELKELARRCTFYGARTIGAFRVLGEADILAIYRAANR